MQCNVTGEKNTLVMFTAKCMTSLKTLLMQLFDYEDNEKYLIALIGNAKQLKHWGAALWKRIRATRRGKKLR